MLTPNTPRSGIGDDSSYRSLTQVDSLGIRRAPRGLIVVADEFGGTGFFQPTGVCIFVIESMFGKIETGCEIGYSAAGEAIALKGLASDPDRGDYRTLKNDCFG